MLLLWIKNTTNVTSTHQASRKCFINTQTNSLLACTPHTHNNDYTYAHTTHSNDYTHTRTHLLHGALQIESPTIQISHCNSSVNWYSHEHALCIHFIINTKYPRQMVSHYSPRSDGQPLLPHIWSPLLPHTWSPLLPHTWSPLLPHTWWSTIAPPDLMVTHLMVSHCYPTPDGHTPDGQPLLPHTWSPLLPPHLMVTIATCDSPTRWLPRRGYVDTVQTTYM